MTNYVISGGANLPDDVIALTGTYTIRLADPHNDPDGSWRGGNR